MFKKRHGGRRSPNILFVIFRLCLSLTIFSVLLFGVYSAYKNFSGIDPLKVEPKTLLATFLSSDEAIKVVDKVLGFKIPGIDKGSIPLVDKNQTIPADIKKEVTQSSADTKVADFSFMLVADSHNDNDYLRRAISQANRSNKKIEFIIGLGDYTDVGTVGEMQRAKKEFDEGGLRYFLVPGDHDLWDSRNRQALPTQNFQQVFGPTFQSFDFKGFKFILVDNSDNYLGLGQAQMDWLTTLLRQSKESNSSKTFVFLQEPLYHPSSDHVMGKVEDKLKVQASDLKKMFKESGVMEVFAGDLHYFTRYQDPDTGLKMTTVGALTSQRNTQAPRFAIVTVYTDVSYDIEDVEVR